MSEQFRLLPDSQRMIKISMDLAGKVNTEINGINPIQGCHLLSSVIMELLHGMINKSKMLVGQANVPMEQNPLISMLILASIIQNTTNMMMQAAVGVIDKGVKGNEA